ncbi:hypothetical protein [Streptomyces sp. H23]|uniref:hypothetical protein n=1 Tax=unclassified Streptomyces TaxID=2593676 RepID=UPI001F0F4E3A|nr:hypothetical protein [Streptomyces sp. H23]
MVGFFEFLGDPIGKIIELVADAILAGAISVFGALTLSVPTLSATGTSAAQAISGQTQWLVVYLAVGSLLFACARMAIERRATAGTTALKGILRVIVVAGGATTIAMAAAGVADSYAQHLFNAGAANVLDNVGACSDGSEISEAFLLLILSFLLLIAGIIQTILLYIRLGVMILLLGTLPVAAASSMTDWGGGWWRKHIGWMIAWLLYKPAAGLVLYAGTELITASSSEGSAVNERIAGIGVLLLSAVALPALLKLVVPATAALGGASAYSGAWQAVGGALASGARSLGGSGGGSDGDDGGGRTGPSGASGTPAPGHAQSSAGPGSVGTAGPAGGEGVRNSAGGSGGGARDAEDGEASGGASGSTAIALTVAAAEVVGRTASGALDDADGDQGHNGSRYH